VLARRSRFFNNFAFSSAALALICVGGRGGAARLPVCGKFWGCGEN
jgi:hypothetical protein